MSRGISVIGIRLIQLQHEFSYALHELAELVTGNINSPVNYIGLILCLYFKYSFIQLITKAVIPCKECIFIRGCQVYL